MRQVRVDSHANPAEHGQRHNETRAEITCGHWVKHKCVEIQRMPIFAGTDDERERGIRILFTRTVAKQGIDTVLKVSMTEVLQD